MKYIVVRDDDVSYFTKPSTLETIYRPLFEENKPVNFAVIPKIIANTETDSFNPYRRRDRLRYDPIIPPEYRGRDETFPLNENKELLDYIRGLGNYEILQHGFTHGLVNKVKEFKVNNQGEIQRRADSGRKLLRECFNRDPMTFVPPWDTVSLEAIQLLKSRYKGLSVRMIIPTRLPFGLWRSYLNKALSMKSYIFYGDLLIVEHPGYLLNRFDASKSIFSRIQDVIETNEIIILVNHHWEYFFDWKGLNIEFYNIWKKVLEHLLGRKDIQFLSFSELYDKLKR